MALIIAGERSGVGKTTVTLALLAALKEQGRSVQSFKVGPDYIDPMFHYRVTGRPCRNLDPVLTSEPYVQACFGRHQQTADAVLVEGVMGLFDGAAGQGDYASTAHVARLLNLPILLVLDCRRLSHSIAALVHGYRSFDPRLQIAGVVLNRVGSDRHLELLQSALSALSVPILGMLRRQDQITIPDRHLGLVPTAELPELAGVLAHLAVLGQTSFAWERLHPLLLPAPLSSGEALPNSASSSPESEAATRFPQRHDSGLPADPPRIAIAQDPAFSFYYADNLEQLTDWGAKLVAWSPLTAEQLPPDIQGLYLGGGFPEMFAADLAANVAARAAVKTAIQAGMPTYAECGGLMYLCEGLTNFAGQTFPMAQVLPPTAVMGSQLTLGYRRAIAQATSPLVVTDEVVYGHEFHRSHLTLPPPAPLFTVNHPFLPLIPAQSPLHPSGAHPTQQRLSHNFATPEGWHYPHLHASYLHLHWGATPHLPQRFVQNCAEWKWQNTPRKR